jgi:hypothetical protein
LLYDLGLTGRAADASAIGAYIILNQAGIKADGV